MRKPAHFLKEQKVICRKMRQRKELADYRQVTVGTTREYEECVRRVVPATTKINGSKAAVFLYCVRRVASILCQMHISRSSEG